MTMGNYKALRTSSGVEKLVNRLIRDGKPFGFDIESGYSGEPREEIALMPFHPDWFLVGFSFTNSLDWAVYVPVAHDSGDNVDDPQATARALWRLLQTGLGVAHNLAFELRGLSRWFRDTLSDDPEVGEAVRESRGLFPYLSDSMLEALLTQDYAPQQLKGPGKDLKELTKHIFGHEMIKFDDLFPLEETDLGPAMKRGQKNKVRFNSRNLVPKVITYACEDSVWCLALHLKHYEQLKGNLIYRTEMALLPVLVEMEMEGILLDWDVIDRKADEVAAFRDLWAEEIQSDLSARLGRTVNINLNSPPQLVKVLFDPKPDGLGLPIKIRSKKTNAPSTGDDALQAIAKADPVIRKILQYRQIAKLYSSYLHKYRTELNYSGNGRAVPNHKQEGAGTGRFAVDGVSYQQWPKPYHYELSDGKSFDFAFKDVALSPEGFRIIGFDFSQVELRVLAGMANETSLLQAFGDGTDIHKATASRMLGIPLDQVTKKDRAKGKTFNFAIVYGTGPDAIAESLTAPDAPVTKEDAIILLNQYFETFSGLKNWMAKTTASAREQGFVHTLFGRKFTIWEYKDHRNFVRSKGDRLSVNAPVQGGAADYMKLGMVRASKVIKKAGMQDKIRLVMTIHDALEFYVHESVSTQEAIDLIQPAISFPVRNFKDVQGNPVTLPEILAEWHEGRTWGSVVELVMDANKRIIGYEWEDYAGEKHKFATIEEAYAYQDTIPRPNDIPGQKIIDALDKTLAEKKKKKESLPEPDEGDDEPPWAHSPEWHAENDEPPMALYEPVPDWNQYRISILEMPTPVQWGQFNDFLHTRGGDFKVILSTPEGDLTLEHSYDFHPDDEGQISLLLGGATVEKVSADADADLVMGGIDL